MISREDPVIERWRQFDWESLQAYLDGEIRAQECRQSSAEDGKARLLAESTKYRETTDKEQRKAALPLIKAFQREVDECRDRERAIGAALVHIFGQLADLPDPRASLTLVSTWSAAAARAATAEEESAALKAEIASITEEFAGLRNQDVTVRQLREQIKDLEKEKMSAIERLLAETEKRIQDSSVEREEAQRELQEKHATSVTSMEKQIVDLEARLRTQQRQLDGVLADAGHKETVEGDEKEEREREMDTLRRKLKVAEREIAALTTELRQAKNSAHSSTSPPASPIEDIAALGGLMKEKDEQIAKLLEENRRLAAKASAEARAAEQKMAKMQNELSKQRELIIHMQAELAGKGDYEAVKQELRALREMELGPEAAAALDDNTPQTTVGEALKKLDKYMSDKNKKLQSENVQLRKTKEELNGFSGSKPNGASSSSTTANQPSSLSTIDETVDAVAALEAIPDALQPVVQAIGLMVNPDGSFSDPSFSEAFAAAAAAAAAAAEEQGEGGEDEDEDGPRLNEPDPDAAQNLFNLLLQSMNSTTEEELLLAEPVPTKSNQSKHRSHHGGSSSGRTPYVHGIESRPLPSSSTRYDRSDPPFVPSQTATIVGKAEPTPAEQKVIKELQARVAANVRGLGQTALNTGEIASQCKRLMVAYNIGQRLFAKFVMNQSQGSLSELLSKPRPWSKLTDKGREAFRRIYGWISDTTAIDLLCSLSPRRVHPGEIKVEHPTPESLWESNQNATLMLTDTRSTDLIREEAPRKVASAKEDQYRSAGTPMASAAVSVPRTTDHSAASNGERRPVRAVVENDSARDHHQQQQQQHSSASSSPSKGSSRWRHDDIPKEKITQIFENELAKLREQESHLERAINHRGSNSSASSSHHSGSSLRKLEAMAETNGELPIQVNYAQQVMTLKIRAGLTPITQEQYEAYPNLDTDELVKNIKEFLSTNSISQKQFGEFVLGLSQGSVSDLLAKPKSWGQLTQKGREPFVRMKLFMRDVDAAIEKDKNKGRAKRPSQPPREPIIHLAHELRTREKAYEPEEPAVPLFAKVKLEPPEEDMRSGILEEVDTCTLVRKVKDRLHVNGISQRDFGEQVLGFTSGSTSDVFLRPKKWSLLTTSKQREPYEKMQEWMDDHLGVVKLMAKLHELKGSTVSTPAAPPAPVPPPVQQESSSNGRTIKRPAPFDPSSFENQNGMGPPRKRTVITDQQKDALKFVFAHEQHPSLTTIEQLADKLGMSVKTVQNWFHNHRTRAKITLQSVALKREDLDHSSSLYSNGGDWLHSLEAILKAAKNDVLIEEERIAPKSEMTSTVVVKKEPISPTHSSASSTISTHNTKPRPAVSILDKVVGRLSALAAGGAS